MYEHTCKRCGHKFISKSQTPIRCGGCKTPYWNVPKKKDTQAVAS